MPEQREQPRPHGDPMDDMVGTNPEENRAQRQSDAPRPDSSPVGGSTDEPGGRSDRAAGGGSSANGIPEFDEASGGLRRKQYDSGAELVSGTD